MKSSSRVYLVLGRLGSLSLLLISNYRVHMDFDPFKFRWLCLVNTLTIIYVLSTTPFWENLRPNDTV